MNNAGDMIDAFVEDLNKLYSKHKIDEFNKDIVAMEKKHKIEIIAIEKKHKIDEYRKCIKNLNNKYIKISKENKL